VNDGEIGRRIDADNLGIVLDGIVRELHLDAVSLLDHVIVGEDIARLIDDHAGAESMTSPLRHVGHPARRRRRTDCRRSDTGSRSSFATVVIFILWGGVPAIAPGDGPALFGNECGRDVDHGRFDLFGDRTERVGQLDRVGNDQRRRARRRDLSLAASAAPVLALTTEPMTIPTASVNTMSVKDNSFCARMLFKT
jgi:hypothetical protein